MPFVSGFLQIRESGGHPDHELPDGEGDTDPGYGIDVGGRPGQGLPPFPSQGLPAPPGVWPPPTPSHPIVPIVPDNSLPTVPPGTIWPPLGRPIRPDQGLPGYGHPDQGLPGRPARPDQGLPGHGHPDQGLPGGGGHPSNGLPNRTFWMIAYCPSLGWRYVAVNPSLQPGMPLPEPEPEPVPEPK